MSTAIPRQFLPQLFRRVLAVAAVAAAVLEFVTADDDDGIFKWLENGGIVLIDEPDFHLHVSLQSHFIHELEKVVHCEPR